MKVKAWDLEIGDVFIGVLSGKPWRKVMYVRNEYRNYDVNPVSGHCVSVSLANLDAAVDTYYEDSRGVILPDDYLVEIVRGEA